jgi:hypothetical protein
MGATRCSCSQIEHHRQQALPRQTEDRREALAAMRAPAWQDR